MCSQLDYTAYTVDHKLVCNRPLSGVSQLIDTESEKDALMSRLTVLDQEKIRLLDEQVTMERKWRENIKVCHFCLYMLVVYYSCSAGV